jgi:hypothetical protein
MEFAFLYDGIQGLKVDVGVKLPQEYTYSGEFTAIPAIYFGRTEPAVMTSPKGDDEVSVQLPRVVSLGVNWTPFFLDGRLNILSRFDYSFGGKIELIKGTSSKVLNETGDSYNMWFVPSYKIIPNLTVGLDLGLEIKLTDNLVALNRNYVDMKDQYGNPEFVVKDSRGNETNPTEWTDFGFAPWFEFGVGGGKVRTGVVVMFPGKPQFKQAPNSRVNYKFKGDPVVSFPISITYSF